MKPIRVLPPAVVIALTASLAASPAWAADAAAPAAATPTAVTATAAGPVDKATIPAFDTRFVVSAAEAARVARPGVLSLIASANLSCRFNGVWTDYSLALAKKNPRARFNVNASIGCAPVANAMGDGSVRVQFGGRVMATKNLSWKTAIRARPALPIVKFPSALKPPQLNALRARIAKTPGGLPVASPGGKATCRMISAWWGYPSDGFPAAPRLKYNLPGMAWVAVACIPVSNAAGSAAVAPANGAAAKGIAWGSFTPYNPPPAPIPAFEMTFRTSAIPGATGVAGRATRSIHLIRTKDLKLRVNSKLSSVVPPRAAITGAYYDKVDADLIHVEVAAMPVDMKAGAAEFVLDYDDVDVSVKDLARIDKDWADVEGSVAPKMPGIKVALPETTITPVIDPSLGTLRGPGISPTGSAAVRPAVGGAAAGGAAAGTLAPPAIGGCAIGGYERRVEWLDRPASPAVLASCSTPWLTHGAMVAVAATAVAAGTSGDDGGTRVASATEVDVPDVTVPPTPPPNDNLGDASWWRYTVPQFWNAPNGQPVRWPTPNTPIDVVVNCPALTDGPCEDEAGRVQVAVAEVRAGGGPNLQYKGVDKSAFVPTKARHTDPTKQGKITVTFTKAAAQAGNGGTDIFNGLGNNAEAGVGGFDWINRNDGKGASIAAGYVAIDSTKLPSMEKWRRQVLYMHELGHSIGLTHPDVARTLPGGTQQPALPSTGQIMDSRLDVPAPRWGNGDLAGLKLVGSQATPPAPEPLPTLGMGGFSSVTKTSLRVGLTVTTVKSAAVCLAYGRADQAPETWAQVPIEVVGPVAGLNLTKNVTGLTAATRYGFRAKLMPTTDCNGASTLLPFTPITTRTTPSI
ncbi:MAG: hypothetical protein QG671_751 [Actinomycetota bacterium]|nr:hypothetical protein [Actinomycetota bacterium]